MILVTAANGNQGKRLVPKLLAAGQDVRACVNSEASARTLHDVGVSDVVVGNIAEPRVLERAVRGIDKIYQIGPTVHPQEREMGLAMVNAARKEGVSHFVLSSVLHAITTDLIQHEIKRDIEEHLISSGLDFTILQPANYMLGHRLVSVFSEDVFRLPWSLDRRQSMVDLEDLTDVACMVLRDPEPHIGATYELASAGRFTGHDLGQILSDVLGRAIRVEELDPEIFIDAVVGQAGADQDYRRTVIRAICARYSSHDFVGNPNVLTWLLGRPPTSFANFARRERSSLDERS